MAKHSGDRASCQGCQGALRPANDSFQSGLQSANGDLHSIMVAVASVTDELEHVALDSLQSGIQFASDGLHSIKNAVASVADDFQIVPSLVQSPACRGCDQPWPFPREVKYVPEFQPLLGQIAPTTHETIVVDQTFKKDGTPVINPLLFEKFTFTTSGKPKHCRPCRRGAEENRLVQGFNYVQNGQGVHIVKDGHEQRKEPDQHTYYMRVVTLNNWHKRLLRALLTVSLSVADMQSNFMLLVALFSYEIYESIPFADRLLFAVVWLASIVFAAVAATQLARWQIAIASNPQVGDLITNCSKFDHMVMLGTLAVFNFFEVEKQVRDIVIMLHPFKSLQPFAAFKCEGHRAYLIGYKSQSMFHVNNGRQPSHIFVMLSQMIVYSFKIYMIVLFFSNSVVWFHCGSLLMSVLFSTGYFFGELRELQTIRRERRALRAQCLDVLRKGPRDEHNHREWNASAKFLALHFGENVEYPQGRCRVTSMSASSYERNFGAGEGKCAKCGRACTHLHVQSQTSSLGHDAERTDQQFASELKVSTEHITTATQHPAESIVYAHDQTSHRRLQTLDRENTQLVELVSAETMNAIGIVPPLPVSYGSSQDPPNHRADHTVGELQAPMCSATVRQRQETSNWNKLCGIGSTRICQWMF